MTSTAADLLSLDPLAQAGLSVPQRTAPVPAQSERDVTVFDALAEVHNITPVDGPARAGPAILRSSAGQRLSASRPESLQNRGIPELTAPGTQSQPTQLSREEELAKVEQLLLEADDLRVLAPELLARALDAGVWYHFNPFRTSPLRVLDLPPTARVLEVGCGAGVVTRYLGEQGFSVVAVEPCEELARCARLRCQELRNVEVVTGYLQDVMRDDGFDLIVCFDPDLIESEYGGAALELFAMCRKLLRVGGSMIAAVGNTISGPAETNVEITRDHARGRGATLGALRDALAGAGFAEHDTLLTFPHHAAPQLFVEPMASRTTRTDWVGEVEALYGGTNCGAAQLLRWWSTIRAEYLDSALAPGWVLVAHPQAQHHPLWGGWSLARCVPQRAGEQPASGRTQPGAVKTVPLGLVQGSESADANGATSPSAGASLWERILRVCRPAVKAVKDFSSEIEAGIARISYLDTERLRLRTQFAQKRLASREQLTQERRGRRAREAELDLVLEHSRTVGALWGELKREKRVLEQRVEQLSARCEATQECMLELVDKVLATEGEVLQLRRSWRGRLKDWILSFFFVRRAPLQLQSAVARQTSV